MDAPTRTSGPSPASTNARMLPACIAPKFPPPERANATVMLPITSRIAQGRLRDGAGSVPWRRGSSPRARRARAFGQRPESRLAILDGDHAVDLKRPQVRDRLPHGGAAHEACDLAPGPGPPHVRGDVPPAAGSLAQDGDDLRKPVPVMLAQLLETGVQVVEAVLVGRKDLVDLVGLELVERGQVVAQRIGAGLWVERDVRRDSGQHVVPRQHQLVARFVEAE